MSHPVRVRGLKQAYKIANALKAPVAPRAGAWIETLKAMSGATSEGVAPRAGAWIETQKHF